MSDFSVYVSYARKTDKDQPVVDKLRTACKNKNIELKVDEDQIKYGESIQEYMNDLSAGRHIIVILSDAYFKSEYCMGELLGIFRNEQFQKRVHPIVLQGTKLYKPADRPQYYKHWDDEKRNLRSEINKLDSDEDTHYLKKSENLYIDIRRNIDNLLEMLAIMNALSYELHEKTNFEEILNRIFSQQTKTESDSNKPGKISYEKYREQIIRNVRKILEKNERIETALQLEITEKKIEAHDMARHLCENECRSVINELLSPAIEKLLKNISESMREETWNAAETLLANICQLVVDKELVIKMDGSKENSGDYGFEMGVKTPFGVEIISSCYRRKSPKLKSGLGESRISGNDAIFEPEIETGWDDDNALDAILREIWKNVFPEDKEIPLNKKFSDDELEVLNETLRLREPKAQFHHYIPVNSKAQQKRLVQPEFYDKLKAKLNDITVIYFNSTEKYVQCIPDENLLMTAAREFLQIGKKS